MILLRKVWLSFIFVTIVLSCKKSATANKPLVTFTFTLNGAATKWNNHDTDPAACILCGPFIHQQAGYFSLGSSAPNNFSDILSFTIKTNSIAIAQYADTIKAARDFTQADHQLVISGSSPINAGAILSGDFATINITSVTGGFYDGNFRATFTDSKTGNKILLEQGEFHNLQVR